VIEGFQPDPDILFFHLASVRAKHLGPGRDSSSASSGPGASVGLNCQFRGSVRCSKRSLPGEEGRIRAGIGGVNSR